ncbi:hypothetical protein TrVE_jg9193 [Triparma verrucosa]|uniref:Uncharacterized protein n=1 Tax=Triparma verrucosa TaxID=1606542 RepID=A0A9W7CMF6_9STRA|nr:hypothetical protein TrVE_jg9193 [Triparma verrucosa]
MSSPPSTSISSPPSPPSTSLSLPPPSSTPWSSTWTITDYQTTLKSTLTQNRNLTSEIGTLKASLLSSSKISEADSERIFIKLTKRLQSERLKMVTKVADMEVEEEGVVNRLLRRVGELESTVRRLERELEETRGAHL